MAKLGSSSMHASINSKKNWVETERDSEFCSHRGCTNCSPAHAAESPSNHSIITPPRPNLTDAVSQRKPHRLRVGVIACAADIRGTLSEVIEASDEFQPCDFFSTASAAIASNPSNMADILVVQLELPNLCGMRAAAELLARKPELQVIIASSLRNPLLIRHACTLGIRHWLVRPFSLGQCLATLRLVSSQIRFAHPCTGALAPREGEFLACLEKGLLYKEIEQRLHISHTSLRKLQHSVYTKLHVTRAAEAIKTWRQLAMIEERDR